MAGRTQEDRATLTYLLTCPFSNIIGAYQIVPRIAASEMGWDTESQFMPILLRLQEAGFIEYDPEQSYVWVHIWWDHNYPRMALGPTLRKRTFSQIRELPEQWRPLSIDDLAQRLPDDPELREIIASAFGLATAADRHPTDRVSEPYPDSIDSGRVNSNSNLNLKENNNPNSTVAALDTRSDLYKFLSTELSPTLRNQIVRLLHDVPDQDARHLLSEQARAMANPGQIKGTPLQYFQGLIKIYNRDGFAPSTQGAISAAALAEHEFKILKEGGI